MSDESTTDVEPRFNVYDPEVVTKEEESRRKRFESRVRSELTADFNRRLNQERKDAESRIRTELQEAFDLSKARWSRFWKTTVLVVLLAISLWTIYVLGVPAIQADQEKKVWMSSCLVRGGRVFQDSAGGSASGPLLCVFHGEIESTR